MKAQQITTILIIIISMLISIYIFSTVNKTNDINNIDDNTFFTNSYNNINNQVIIEEAKLIRVVDGDTIVVNIKGKNKKVRMLEINCPESVASDEKRNTKEGEDAHHFTENLLKNVKKVYLTKDKSNKDIYGRLLRIVWLEKPKDVFDEEELRKKCVNAIILLNGHAEVVKYDDDSYVDIFNKFYKEGLNKNK